MFAKTVVTDPVQVNQVFNRYIAAVFPSKEKALKLMTSGKRLTFYLGIDPTGPDIHLGNATNLLVLKKLISLGHRVILLIGDFTAQTGDPTEKDTTRRVLNPDEVKRNMKTYLSQVEKILKRGSFEVKYNSQWLQNLTFGQFRTIARLVTVQQQIARDMFQRRIQEQRPITVEEFLYPLMQGYDSVAMAVDGEVGGNDQTFNMLVGRDLVRAILKKEKIVLTTRLLEDPAGGKKIMNKSEGRYIAVGDEPTDMFGKVMAMPDSAIIPLFSYTTEVPDEKIREIEERIESGENPKSLKLELAYELVRMYHGPNAAQAAQDEFERVYAQGQLPEKIQEFKMTIGQDIVEILVLSGLVESKTEARRLIEQGGVKVNGQVVSDWHFQVKPGRVIKVGPRRFLRLT